MPLLAGLIIALQVICGIHVVRTGRPLYWIFIIVVAPLLGSIIYILSQMLPDMSSSPAARRLKEQAIDTIDPERRLRMLTDRFDTADTADTRKALAEEYMRHGRHAEAVPILEGALGGVHATDPILLQTLARAHFARGDFVQATQTLERIKASNPNYESADAHLLYARGLEGEGRLAEARAEYEAVARYFPGVEAKCHYAQFLDKQGELSTAQTLYGDVVRSLDKAGRHFKRDQREWYDLAKRNLTVPPGK